MSIVRARHGGGGRGEGRAVSTRAPRVGYFREHQSGACLCLPDADGGSMVGAGKGRVGWWNIRGEAKSPCRQGWILALNNVEIIIYLSRYCLLNQLAVDLQFTCLVPIPFLLD